MHRREFVELAVGTIATGAIARRTAQLARVAASEHDAAGHPAPVTLKEWSTRRRFVETAFGRIACVERGAGEGALFLHGFPLNGFQWRDAMERLAPYRRCIAPDLLGMGFTHVAAGQSVAPGAQVEMLVALLDALGTGAVDVVANDSGGAVAQLLVARHPQRVRTLLLTNCDVETDSPPAAMAPVIELAHAGTYADRWLAPWLADHTLARSRHGLGGMTYTFPSHPTDDAIECYLFPLLMSPARKALTNAYAIALQHNPLLGIEPSLRHSTVPTRIVWGTGDTIFSPDSPRYLDRVLGNSRGVRLVKGARLFFPEEYPALIAEEALRLWSWPSWPRDRDGES